MGSNIQSLIIYSSTKYDTSTIYDMSSTGGFQMGPIEVFVKVEDCPVRAKPPSPVDSMADTMYFLNIIRQEKEEEQRQARDEKIVKLAMEQKRKLSLNSRSHLH